MRRNVIPVNRIARYLTVYFCFFFCSKTFAILASAFNLLGMPSLVKLPRDFRENRPHISVELNSTPKNH